MNSFEIKQYEPKKENRFIATLPEEFDIPKWAIRSTSRPIIKPLFSEMEINGAINRLSIGFELEPIQITFIDPIEPSTTRKLWEVMIGMGIINDKDAVSPSISKNLIKKFNNFRKKGFNYTLEMLDPTGTTIEKWKIKGCFIKECHFNDLSYTSDNIVTTTLVIQPNQVVLEY